MGQLVLTQQATPNSAPNGGLSLFVDTNNNLNYINSAGSIGGLMNGKNRIINGDMRIAQRGTSFTTVADGTYTADRFRYDKSGPVHTITQDTASVPTTTQAGRFYKYSLKAAVTTLSVATTDYTLISQRIEGYNIADIVGDGYNSGFTISFWVRDTITGIHCVSFRNTGGNRCYIAEYTINAADTWEKKTITVTAVPSAGGTWDSINGVGLLVGFAIMCGSTSGIIGTANTWNSSNCIATANQVNGCSSTSNIFQITGVQLEAGPIATPFEYRNIQQELALCQRYCFVPGYLATGALATGANVPIIGAGVSNSIANGLVVVFFPSQMRSLPILTATAGQWLIVDGVTNPSITAFSLSSFSGNSIALNGAATITAAGRGLVIAADGSGARLMIFSAEL